MVLLTGEPLGQRRSLTKKGGHEHHHLPHPHPPHPRPKQNNEAKPQKHENSAQSGSSRFCAVLPVAAQNRKQACHVGAVEKIGIPRAD